MFYLIFLKANIIKSRELDIQFFRQYFSRMHELVRSHHFSGIDAPEYGHVKLAIFFLILL